MIIGRNFLCGEPGGAVATGGPQLRVPRPRAPVGPHRLEPSAAPAWASGRPVPAARHLGAGFPVPCAARSFSLRDGAPQFLPPET